MCPSNGNNFATQLDCETACLTTQSTRTEGGYSTTDVDEYPTTDVDEYSTTDGEGYPTTDVDEYPTTDGEPTTGYRETCL